VTKSLERGLTRFNDEMGVVAQRVVVGLGVAYWCSPPVNMHLPCVFLISVENHTIQATSKTYRFSQNHIQQKRLRRWRPINRQNHSGQPPRPVLLPRQLTLRWPPSYHQGIGTHRPCPAQLHRGRHHVLARAVPPPPTTHPRSPG
jgi:hypothetical protein